MTIYNLEGNTLSNNAIKTLKRASFGCQNFSRFRKRFLLSFSLHPTFDIEPKTRIKVLCLDLRFLLSPLQPHHYRKAAFEIIGVRVMSVWSDRPKTVVDIREIIGIGRWIGVCGGCEVFVEQLLRGGRFCWSGSGVSESSFGASNPFKGGT